LKSNKGIQVGDAATFYNVMCKKPSSSDFQRYQIKEQILATVFDEKIVYNIDHRPSYSLRNWIWCQKNRLLDCIKNKLSPDGFRIFSSLFLGNRACIK